MMPSVSADARASAARREPHAREPHARERPSGEARMQHLEHDALREVAVGRPEEVVVVRQSRAPGCDARPVSRR
jgi:hypothetical protein